MCVCGAHSMSEATEQVSSPSRQQGTRAGKAGMPLNSLFHHYWMTFLRVIWDLPHWSSQHLPTLSSDLLFLDPRGEGRRGRGRDGGVGNASFPQMPPKQRSLLHTAG